MEDNASKACFQSSIFFVPFLGSFTKTSASFLPFTLSAPQIPVIHSVNFATFLGIPTGSPYRRGLDLLRLSGRRAMRADGRPGGQGLMMLLCGRRHLVVVTVMLLLLLNGQQIVGGRGGRDGGGGGGGCTRGTCTR